MNDVTKSETGSKVAPPCWKPVKCHNSVMQLRIRPNAILEEEFQYGGRVFLPPELLPQPWIEVKKTWNINVKNVLFNSTCKASR